jgi:hypothetical protein
VNARERPLGARGLALLVITGVAGLILAMHGWSVRHSGLTASTAGGLNASAAPRPAVSTGAGTHAASPGRAGPPASSAAGPLLSAEPYAPYAFQVWPGTPSAVARQAMAGLTISATRRGNGILVTAAANGQQAGAHTYPRGARVYVVESSLGDDSGSSDYNLGDDGLVVTDAQGRIVQ